MKIASAIAGLLLGLLFTVFGLNYFLHFIPMKGGGPAAGTPAAMFMGALIPTGYFAFVKVIEISGGLLVILPVTRNIGLLLLGPVIVNILCFHIFINKGATLVDPVNLGVPVLALFLLWAERGAFAKLVTR